MAAPWTTQLLVSLLLTLMIDLTCGYKILLLPSYTKSHMLNSGLLGKTLLSRGHDVTVVHPDRLQVPEQFIKSGINFIEFPTRDEFNFEKYNSEKTLDLAFNFSIGGLKKFGDFVRYTVDGEALLILDNKELMRKLHDEKFHFLIGDLTFPHSVIAGVLRVQWGYMVPECLLWESKAPYMPSYVPFMVSQSSEKMTFQERIGNALKYAAGSALAVGGGYEITAKYLNTKKPTSYSDLFAKADLCFRLKDIPTDFTRPLNPNMINVGSIMARPANPLSSDLSKIIAEIKSDIIVVSFGSWLEGLPDKVLVKMINAFAQLDTFVIWKHKGSLPTALPSNVKTMKWLPQNDLLANPKVKLLIFQGGANSLVEAVYNGVPMIVFPLLFDQYTNAALVESKGYGVKMDLAVFSTAELVANIKKTIGGDYQDRMRKASGIYKDLTREGANAAGFWIEHVIQHGSEHLRPHAQDMVWYQYLMLDVLIVFMIVLLVIGLVLKFIITKVLRICIGKPKSVKSKSD